MEGEQPEALIHSITVTHSRFPDCKSDLRLEYSALVVTFTVAANPIAKPVVSKS